MEFTTAGISSQSMQDIIAALVNGSDLFKALGLDKLVPELDHVLEASNKAGQYVAARSRSNGIALAEVNAAELKVEFRRWETETVLQETYVEPAEVLRFTVASGTKKIVAA